MRGQTKFYLLNARKSREVMHSMMNDKDLEDFTALAVTEPHALRLEDQRIITTPMGHTAWTKVTPCSTHEGRHPFRSMIWVSAKVDFKQIVVESLDVTMIQLEGDTDVIIASIYIPGPASDTQIVDAILGKVKAAIEKVKQSSRKEIEILLMGDFNRHDQMWGGPDVIDTNPNEGDRILEMMMKL
jgi:exonuclease III